VSSAATSVAAAGKRSTGDTERDRGSAAQRQQRKSHVGSETPSLRHRPVAQKQGPLPLKHRSSSEGGQAPEGVGTEETTGQISETGTKRLEEKILLAAREGPHVARGKTTWSRPARAEAVDSNQTMDLQGSVFVSLVVGKQDKNNCGSNSQRSKIRKSRKRKSKDEDAEQSQKQSHLPPRSQTDHIRSQFFTHLFAGGGHVDEAFSMISAKKFDLSVDDLNDALMMLSRNRKMKAALRVVQEAKEKWGLLPPDNVKTASILIDMYGKAKMLTHAMEVFESIQKRGIKPNLVTFNSMLSAAGRTDNPALAFSLFRRMASDGIKPDKFSFGALIDGCAKAGMVDKALEVSQAMEDGGIPKDQTTYATLMEACSRAADMRRLFLTFEEMKRKGIWPNLIVFAILIDACANALQPERAFEVFRDMKHWELEPNVIIFTSLIDACAKGGMPDKANLLLQEMVQFGVTPNEKTFGALIDAWVRAGNYDQAFKVLENVQASGVEINCVLGQSLLQICSVSNRFDGALTVWNLLRGAEVKLFRSAYVLMLRICIDTGMYEMALEVAEEAAGRNFLSPQDREMRVLMRSLFGGISPANDMGWTERINKLVARYGASFQAS